MAPRLNKETAKATLIGKVSSSVPEDTPTSIGLVHLGFGGFARAHLGTILNDMEPEHKTEWGVSAVSMRSPTMRDQLEPQDGLYTVTERQPDGDKATLVDVVKETLVAPEDPEAVVERLAHPDTKTVTMTVTQQGYDLPIPSPDTPDDDYDEVATNVTYSPSATSMAYDPDKLSIYSVIAEAALRRHRRGLQPFTAVSLDNVPENGDVLKVRLEAFAKQLPEGYATAVEKIQCPNTMVDRITPSPTPEDIAAFERSYGVLDKGAVTTEPFRQLVIEDAEGLPPIKDVPGVKVVDDVKPFEAAKIKMLNGTHMMMGALGRVAGFQTVDECMADQDMGAFSKRFLAEVAATIDPIPNTNMQVYADDLADRFSNPRMGDSVDRLANDTSKKVHPRLFDALTDSIKKGTPNDALSVAAAGWVRFMAGDAPGHSKPDSEPGATIGLTDTGRAYTISDQKRIEKVGGADVVVEDKAFDLQNLARSTPGNPDKLFKAVGLDLAEYGAEGRAARRKIVAALETMNNDSALAAIRSVSMRLDALPKPVVPAADRGQEPPKTGPAPAPQSPGPQG